MRHSDAAQCVDGARGDGGSCPSCNAEVAVHDHLATVLSAPCLRFTWVLSAFCFILCMPCLVSRLVLSRPVSFCLALYYAVLPYLVVSCIVQCCRVSSCPRLVSFWFVSSLRGLTSLALLCIVLVLSCIVLCFLVCLVLSGMA